MISKGGNNKTEPVGWSKNKRLIISVLVKSDFVLEKDFPNTTHGIIEEKPKEVADKVKAFINKN